MKYTCSVADNIHLTSSELEKLMQYTDVIFNYDKSEIITSEDSIIKNIADADIAITDTLVELSDKIIKECPNLKLLVRSGTSTEGLSQGLLKSKIQVCNIPSYASDSAAEYVFAQIFALTRQVNSAHKYMQYGGNDVFVFRGELLEGKTLGVIGAGQVGLRVSHIARAFGMKVKIFSSTFKKGYSRLEEVLASCDILVFTPRLDPKEYYDDIYLINQKEVEQMKDGVLLISVTDSINCFDISAVTKGIMSKKISAVAIDNEAVRLEKKFGIDGKKFVVMPNVLATPNIAFNTTDSIKLKNKLTIQIVKDFTLGKNISALYYK